MTIARSAFQLSFQISPIILSGGIATYITGGLLPIVALTQAASYVNGLLSGDIDVDLDNFLCHFQPISGSTLISNEIGNYPFANQEIAANAIIAQPLRVSLMMSAPVSASAGYISKFVTMTALQASLAQHNALGGTYIVATPSFIYNNCILKSVSDVSSGQSKQAQQQWRFDFDQPLITQSQADQVVGNLLSKIDGGSKVTSSAWTTASNAISNAGSTLITGAKNLIGSI